MRPLPHPALVFGLAKFMAKLHADSSPGSRAALAALADDVAGAVEDEYVGPYLAGLADGLRREPSARGKRRKPVVQ